MARPNRGADERAGCASCAQCLSANGPGSPVTLPRLRANTHQPRHLRNDEDASFFAPRGERVRVRERCGTAERARRPAGLDAAAGSFLSRRHGFARRRPTSGPANPRALSSLFVPHIMPSPMPKAYGGKFWDELTVGQEFWTGGRTVTEGDVLAFSGLTGDFNPLHTDEEFARTASPFGTRVPHGPLIHDMYLGVVDRLG